MAARCPIVDLGNGLLLVIADAAAIIADLVTRLTFGTGVLTDVNSHDALSALVVKTYRPDKAKADADVTAWMADECDGSRVFWRRLSVARLTHGDIDYALGPLI